MKKIIKIDSKRYLELLKNSKESPQVRPENESKVIDADRWIKAFKNSAEYPQVRPNNNKKRSDEKS